MGTIAVYYENHMKHTNTLFGQNAEFYGVPITVAARSKAWTVFARSNTGIVGSNPTQDMDVCGIYSVFVLFCV
jgi:hypothetical protein